MDLDRRRVRTVVLVTVQLAIAFVVWRQVAHAGAGYHLDSDPARYRAIVNAAGTPYRDFPVEYPPGALALFHVLGPAGFDAFVRHLILCNLACQAAITYMLWTAWGARAGWSYLVLSAPLMPILYTRYDLFAVFIAVLGAFLLKRRRPIGAGICWAAAVFVKLWPAVLVPGLAARRETRAFCVSLAVGLGGLVAWVLWGGFQGPRQVATYRSAKGWEFESVPGSLLRLATRGELRLEQGAWRLGSPPGAASAGLLLVLVVLVAGVWWFVAGHDVRDGVAEVAVVGAVLVTGTLLSPQFVVWVLPFVAIAAVRRLEIFAGAASVLTFVSWSMFDVNHAAAAGTELTALARNAALVGLLVAAIVELGRAGKPATMEHGHPARARQHS